MAHDFDFEDGLLRFNIDTGSMEESAFELALSNAFRWSKGNLKIDISLTAYISSTAIGLLIAEALSCRSRGSGLTVVARGQVAEMLRRTGFDKAGVLEDPGPDGRPDA